MPVLGDPSEFDPSKVRFPTPEEKERELRISFIYRADSLPSEADICRLSGLATWRILKHTLTASPDRFLNYWQADAQPKIALKAKNEGQLLKALGALGDIPFVTIQGPDGKPFMAAVGPACRAELGKTLNKFQLLDIPVPTSTADPLIDRDWSENGNTFTIVVRRDAGMPYGKLAAQSGHAVMGALQRLNPDLSADLSLGFDPVTLAWDKAGCPIFALAAADLENMNTVAAEATAAGINKAYIIDNGRTVFNEPTATVLGLGPVPYEALAQLHQKLSPVF